MSTTTQRPTRTRWSASLSALIQLRPGRRELDRIAAELRAREAHELVIVCVVPDAGGEHWTIGRGPIAVIRSTDILGVSAAQMAALLSHVPDRLPWPACPLLVRGETRLAFELFKWTDAVGAMA
jgi:hypothetical protein